MSFEVEFYFKWHSFEPKNYTVVHKTTRISEPANLDSNFISKDPTQSGLQEKDTCSDYNHWSDKQKTIYRCLKVDGLSCGSFHSKSTQHNPNPIALASLTQLETSQLGVCCLVMHMYCINNYWPMILIIACSCWKCLFNLVTTQLHNGVN